jgi:hypothetical protein
VCDVIPWLNHAHLMFSNIIFIEITSMMQRLLLKQIASSCPKCLRIDLDVFTSSKFFLWGKVHNIMTPIIHNQL